MTNIIFDEQYKLVIYPSQHVDMPDVVYGYHQWFAEQFVNRCLHYNGFFRSLVTDDVFQVAYSMCDGFGPGSVVLDIETGMVRPATSDDIPAYDWSHVRDSTSEAKYKVAQYLVQAMRWADGSIEAMADKWLEDCNKHGLNPTVYG
jgi:hypothetical protein